MKSRSRWLLIVGVLLMGFGIPGLASAQTVVECAASATPDFENCATSQFFTQAMQWSLGFGLIAVTYVLPSTTTDASAYVLVSAQVYQSGGGPGPAAYVYSPSLTMTPVGQNGVSLTGLTEAQQEQVWRDNDVVIYGLDRMAPLTIDGASFSGFPLGFITDTDSQLQAYLATSQPGIWSSLLARQSVAPNSTYIFRIKYPNGDVAAFTVRGGGLSWDFPAAHDINGNPLLPAGDSYPVGCPASQNCPHPGINTPPSWPQAPPSPNPPCGEGYIPDNFGDISTVTIEVGDGNGTTEVTVPNTPPKWSGVVCNP